MPHNTHTPPRPPMPDADDRFVDALLNEHARLGAGDDKALLALIRARTVEHPGSDYVTSELKFGILQWSQVAAVVLLIGVSIAVAVRNFVPVEDAPAGTGPLIAAHAPAPDDEPLVEAVSHQPPVKQGTAAPHADPKMPIVAPLDKMLTGISVEFSPSFAGEWQSPLTAPLSTIAIGENRPDQLSIEALQELIGNGRPIPEGAVSVSGLLGQFNYDYPRPSSDSDTPVAIDLAAATSPWNSDLHLVRVAVQARDENAQSTPRDQVELVADETELQVEFNPAQVARYRLLGYSADAKGGASTFAAGQQLTALYEVETADRDPVAADQLKYQSLPAGNAAPAASTDLLSANFHYHHPNSRQGHTHSVAITRSATRPWQQIQPSFQLASATAMFTGLLRENAAQVSRADLSTLDRLLNASGPQAEDLQELVLAWSAR